MELGIWFVLGLGRGIGRGFRSGLKFREGSCEVSES